MKTKLMLILLVLSSSILTGCSYSSSTGRESYKAYGEQVEDRKIVLDIRSNFHKNSSIPAHLLNLSIDRGIVQLSGFVRTIQEADLALATARNTPGVKSVINNIIVLSDPSYAETRARAEAYNTNR